MKVLTQHWWRVVMDESALPATIAAPIFASPPAPPDLRLRSRFLGARFDSRGRLISR